MNRIEIVNIIKSHDFDIKEYAVISSAAMVLYNMKTETKDIDLYVTKRYYDYLLKNYDCKFERINEGTKVYFIDNIINFGINYKPNKTLLIDGIVVSSIEDIVNLKRYLNREKDRNDLKLMYERKLK